MDPDQPPSSGKLRRTWLQRLLVTAIMLGAVASFVSATAIWFAHEQLEERNLVAIEPGAASLGADSEFGPIVTTDVDDASGDDGSDDVSSRPDIVGGPFTSNPNEPVETFPAAEPIAQNILITGADNNSCIDPDSKYAPAFGNRDELGERSDTIMMWRINPVTSQVAVLSFPRDLWVSIGGRSSKNRINAAYERDDPQRLINTIAQNFGIFTDHYIQVDFCAFKSLVDAVDGVAVPFERSIRDVNTGLNVEIAEPTCFTFDGDHALAYVRSRKLQVIDDDGEWRDADGFSDLSRISRQQDFIRRVLDEAIANRFSPSVIRSLLQTSEDFIVTDTGLTVDRILRIAGVLRSIDPSEITTYQIKATDARIQGNAVLLPDTDGDNMQAILSLFRGDATLAERPEQDLDESTSTTGPPTTVPITTAAPTTDTGSDSDSQADGGTETTTTQAVPVDTTPEVDAEETVFGAVPDGSVSCTD